MRVWRFKSRCRIGNRRINSLFYFSTASAIASVVLSLLGIRLPVPFLPIPIPTLRRKMKKRGRNEVRASLPIYYIWKARRENFNQNKIMQKGEK